MKKGNKDKPNNMHALTFKASGLVKKAKFQLSEGKVLMNDQRKKETKDLLLSPNSLADPPLQTTKKYVKKAKGKYVAKGRPTKDPARISASTNTNNTKCAKKYKPSSRLADQGCGPGPSTSDEESEGDYGVSEGNSNGTSKGRFCYKYWAVNKAQASKEHGCDISTNSVATQTTPLGTGLYWPVPPLVCSKPFTASLPSPSTTKPGAKKLVAPGPKVGAPVVPDPWSVIFKRMTELIIGQDYDGMALLLRCCRVCKAWYECIMRPGKDGNWNSIKVSGLCRGQTLKPAILAFVAKCQPCELDASNTNLSYSSLTYLLRWLPTLQRLSLKACSGRAVILPAFLNSHPPPLWLESLDLAWCTDLSAPLLHNLLAQRWNCHRPGFASGAQKYLSTTGSSHRSNAIKKENASDKAPDPGGSSYLPFKNLKVLCLAGTEALLQAPVIYDTKEWDAVANDLAPGIGAADTIALKVGYSIYANLPNLTSLDVSYCQPMSPYFLKGLSGLITDSEQPKRRSKIESFGITGVLKPSVVRDSLPSYTHYLTKKYFPALKAINIGAPNSTISTFRENLDKNIIVK